MRFKGGERKQFDYMGYHRRLVIGADGQPTRRSPEAARSLAFIRVQT
jgi:hypothetical protein